MIFARLSNREKYAIYMAVGFIGLFVLARFVIFPLFDERKRLARMVSVRQKVLKDMHALKSEYEAIQERQALVKKRFAKRKKGFTLFAFLGRLAGQVGIKDHISYMKPSTSAPKDSVFKFSIVEMKLKGVSLKQLVAYMHKVELSADLVTIKRMSISKEGKQKKTITATLQVETLES